MQTELANYVRLRCARGVFFYETPEKAFDEVRDLLEVGDTKVILDVVQLYPEEVEGLPTVHPLDAVLEFSHA